MSDTPRTDACEYVAMRRHAYYDRFAIARELERELAAMQAQWDRLAEALRDVAKTSSSTRLRRVAKEALAAVKGKDE